MEKELIFALISIGIYLFGTIPLWKDIISGRTIPHVFSYLVWMILVGFNLFILASNKEYMSMFPATLMFGSVIFCCYYGFLGYKKITINWFDYICLGLSFLLILYWVIERNTLNTIIFTAIIDLIAFLPTFKKGWLQPWTESIFIYFMSAVGQVFTLLALSGFQNTENMIFWGYLFFANLVFFFMVAYRRYFLKGWKSIFE